LVRRLQAHHHRPEPAASCLKSVNKTQRCWIGNDDSLPLEELLPEGSIDTSSYDALRSSRDGDNSSAEIDEDCEWPDVAMVPSIGNAQAAEAAVPVAEDRLNAPVTMAARAWKVGDVCMCTYHADHLTVTLALGLALSCLDLVDHR
jgi:hypothetical protein